MRRFLASLLIAATLWFFNAPFVLAANSHSIDLELSSNQFLSRADEAALSLTGDWTVEAWVNFESIPSVNGTTWVVVCKSTGTEPDGEYCLRYRQTDTGTKQLFIGMTQAGCASAYELTYDVTFNTSQWYHLAATKDDVEGLKLFVDTTNVATNGAATNGGCDTTGSFYIGQNQPGSDFDGLIDDVRLWSTNRSQAQIAANDDCELSGSEASLVGYWKLNNALTDSTANALTLTENNSPVFSTTIPTFTGDCGAAAAGAGRRRFIF